MLVFQAPGSSNARAKGYISTTYYSHIHPCKQFGGNDEGSHHNINTLSTATSSLDCARNVTADHGNVNENCSCHVCGKIFSGYYCKYNLRKHLVLHSGLRPYVCTICQTTFSQKGNMKRHMTSVHGSQELPSSASEGREPSTSHLHQTA